MLKTNNTVVGVWSARLTLAALFLVGAACGVEPERAESVAIAEDAAFASSKSIGGTVSGLATGQSLLLLNNVNSNYKSIGSNGPFTMSRSLLIGANYVVVVNGQPENQTCTVTNGSGTLGLTPVTNIMVNCATAPNRASKWKPGIYAKIEDWQIDSSAEMNRVFEDLATTPQLRGIKIMILWGRHESKDSSGVITRDFSLIENVLSRLVTLNATLPSWNQKHLILGFSWRSFEAAEGVTLLLPNDLRAGAPWNGDPLWAHTKYNNAWAYRISADFGGTYAYNIKLWDPVIRSRIDNFLAALAARVDNHPNFNHMSTTESAVGVPVISYAAEGGTEAGEFAGQMAIVLMMRHHFVKSLVIPDLNFSHEHVANMVGILESESIGLGSSNSNKSIGLIRTTPLDAPGVLTYYPTLTGKVPLAPEIQGFDLRGGGYDGVGIPSYTYLYRRVRDDLRANYTVIQRNLKFWYGNPATGTPSMLNFIRTNPDIVNDTSGAGGLNANMPASY